MIIASIVICGCKSSSSGRREEIIIFHAGSLSVPLKEAASVYEKNNPRLRKCNMCYDKISKGEGTACSEACPTSATLFGDIEELKKEAEEN